MADLGEPKGLKPVPHQKRDFNAAGVAVVGIHGLTGAGEQALGHVKEEDSSPALRGGGLDYVDLAIAVLLDAFE